MEKNRLGTALSLALKEKEGHSKQISLKDRQLVSAKEQTLQLSKEMAKLKDHLEEVKRKNHTLEGQLSSAKEDHPRTVIQKDIYLTTVEEDHVRTTEKVTKLTKQLEETSKQKNIIKERLLTATQDPQQCQQNQLSQTQINHQNQQIQENHQNQQIHQNQQEQQTQENQNQVRHLRSPPVKIPFQTQNTSTTNPESPSTPQAQGEASSSQVVNRIVQLPHTISRLAGNREIWKTTIPQDLIGYVIGEQGWHTKELQANHRVRIVIKDEEQAAKLQIIGTNTNIADAFERISKKVLCNDIVTGCVREDCKFLHPGCPKNGPRHLRATIQSQSGPIPQVPHQSFSQALSHNKQAPNPSAQPIRLQTNTVMESPLQVSTQQVATLLETQLLPIFTQLTQTLAQVLAPQVGKQ